jgi:acyl CoA:acetate/3-ketoacid CoA transferase alpha subunit/acyl CoA:acetate/3-ketoacid CoA transferase beta subunit
MTARTNRLAPLSEAIAGFVEPGMQLCFASTPSRSNAAIRELARQFRGKKPEFVLSATGFHSLLHLLGVLRLGRRYVGCFFGDNYPAPRANRLYSELLREGYDIEHWSLWSYVSALAAGAYGQPFAFTRSLVGTSLGAQLAERGKLFEVSDPSDPERRLAMVRAMSPDITFLHAPLGDAHGNVAFSPPYGEGFYSGLAARRGCIITVERVVSADVLDTLPHFRPLPAHRVLAVCEEPFGAHPQPLHVAPAELRALTPGYADDYAAYQAWRTMSQDPQAFSRFTAQVLDAGDGAAGYHSFVSAPRLQGLRRVPASVPPPAALTAEQLEPTDDLLLLAGRALARRVAQGGHRSILAGIGQAFAACRLAKLLLGDQAADVELMIETGFAGIDIEDAHPFLLSRENVASAARLTSIDNMLGSLCCGGTSTCIGVIGAAEVDVDGNVNSTESDGELLVGAGGAPDIAACAREVMVLTRADPRRLVRKVQYITSLGHNVRTIATEACVFERGGPGEPWLVRDVVPARAFALKELLKDGGFRFAMPGPPPTAPPPSALELELLARLRVPARAPAFSKTEATHG